MSDIVDKPDNPTVEGTSIGADGLSAFFEKCEGRVWPVIVRPEIGAYMAGMPPEVQEVLFKGMHPAYANAIMYSEGWLDKYDEVDHTCHCAMCSAAIVCEAENDNCEVGAFLVLQKSDLDLTAGGVVFPICGECAKTADHELNEKFSSNIGGTYTKRSLAADPDVKVVQVDEPAPAPVEQEKPAEPPAQEDVNLLVGE